MAIWETATAGALARGVTVRLSSGAEFEVARVDSPFLGMDQMVCLIEDTPTRWHAYPTMRDAEVEIRRGA